MRRLALLLAAAVALAPVACKRCGEPPPVRTTPAPPAVALVNGEPITAEAFARELRGAGADARDPVLRRKLLDDAVDRVLLLQQARARSLVVPPEQVERAFLRLRGEYPGTHFDDLLAQERVSEAELKTRLRDQLTVERVFAEEVFRGVEVTDAELERAYAERAQEFDRPEEVHAYQIVVRTREEAQRLRDELRRRPKAFADVARRASIAPEARSGGDLGWFGKGSGMPEVFDACFALRPNTLSDVVPSPYGFHLFKVVARRPAQRVPFADVKAQLRDRLLREKRAAAQQQYLATVRGQAKIQLDAAALDAVSP